jgi:hypothetical protein
MHGVAPQMCGRVASPLLGQGAGGRSPGFLMARLAGAQASCEGSHSMDDNTLSALRTQLVRLIINQGTIFSNWIKFAITVQGALAAGLGFALSDAKYRVFGLIMALLGIGTALGFAAILVRQAQWLMWFAQRWNSLATTSEIFPTRPGEIVRLNPGRVAMLVGGCLLLVAIAWIVIFVVVLLNAAPEGAVE